MRARATTTSSIDRFRPGHADYTYAHKYGHRDHRGGGRSSARETVMRVAAGAMARKYLAERLQVRISGYLSQIGALALDPVRPEAAYENPFFCPDPARVPELEKLLWDLRSAGDSVGARVTVSATGVPPGLGEPVFDRLDADIAHAMMGINAVKAVEIGAGVRAAAQRGSEHRDELTPQRIPRQQRRRRARRHFHRPAAGRAPDVQADLEHPGARPQHRSRRQSGRDRDDGPA